YHAVNTVNGLDSQILSYEAVPPGTNPPNSVPPFNFLKLTMNRPQPNPPAPLDLFGGNPSTAPATWLLQPGDYLETPTGGTIYTIQSVTFDPNNTPPNPAVGDVIQLGQAPPTLPATGTTDYRIIRGPRVLPGEQALLLTQDT